VEQVELLRHAVLALDRIGIPYAIVGSFASSAWGESRFTQDIDIVVDLPPHKEQQLCDAFGDPAFYLSQTAVHDAVSRRGQFNVLHPASGNKIDFMIARKSEWSQAQFQRRRLVPLFPDCNAYFAAPDDVIVGKLWYFSEGGSEKHLRDIAGMLKISGELIDRQYVAKHAAEFGVLDIWNSVLERLEKTAGD